MRAKQWVELLKDRGVNIKVNYSILPWFGAKGGCYYWHSDKIELGVGFSDEVVFHELSHWSGHDSRLERDFTKEPANLLHNSLERELEESIAWESTKLLTKFFKSRKKWHNTYANNYLQNDHTRSEGKRAYHFLINELNLDQI